MKGTLGAARVAVLADDLIWATRLAEHLRTAGATPVPCRSAAQLEAALAAVTPEISVDAVVIDLTARAYDGIEAVRRAAATGRPVLAVGQHDDHELRRRAIEAGAGKVFAYRRLVDDGAAVLGLWLASAGEPDILRHADTAPEAPVRPAR